MKKVVIQLLLACFVLSGCSGPVVSDQHIVSEQPPSVSPILYQARHILSNLKSTRYSHKTRIDERSGVYASDCCSSLQVICTRFFPKPEYLDLIERTARVHLTKEAGASIGSLCALASLREKQYLKAFFAKRRRRKDFVVYESIRFVAVNDGGSICPLPGVGLMPGPQGQDVYLNALVVWLRCYVQIKGQAKEWLLPDALTVWPGHLLNLKSRCVILNNFSCLQR